MWEDPGNTIGGWVLAGSRYQRPGLCAAASDEASKIWAQSISFSDFSLKIIFKVVQFHYWLFWTKCLCPTSNLFVEALTLSILNCGVGEDSWESLDCKEIQPVHSERDQPWDFFGRNDAKAETPVVWPPHVTSWLIGKDSDAGRDWGQEEKGTTEDEMAGWHHWLNGRESEWTPGVGDGQRGLACCDSWGRKESDTTERLNWT